MAITILYLGCACSKELMNWIDITGVYLPEKNAQKVWRINNCLSWTFSGEGRAFCKWNSSENIHLPPIKYNIMTHLNSIMLNLIWVSWQPEVIVHIKILLK